MKRGVGLSSHDNTSQCTVPLQCLLSPFLHLSFAAPLSPGAGYGDLQCSVLTPLQHCGHFFAQNGCQEAK